MSTENTSTKIGTPAGDSHSERKMIIDKRSIYQNPFFIIASSLLASLVLVLVTSNSGIQHSPSSAYGSDAGTLEGVDYVATTDNSALTMDIFGKNGKNSNYEYRGAIYCAGYACDCNKVICCWDGFDDDSNGLYGRCPAPDPSPIAECVCGCIPGSKTCVMGCEPPCVFDNSPCGCVHKNGHY